MDIKFQDREHPAAWRGRGRPPREPSARVLDLLRYTAATNTVASVALDDTTGPDELRDIRADLKAAQRVLGGQVHYQVAGGAFRFFWEPGADRG